MCLIIVKKEGVDLPKAEWLQNAEQGNQDGIGVAWKKKGVDEVHIKKDFINHSTLNIWLRENIAKEDICLIHFRYATHGLKDIGNRHPFPITKEKALLRMPEVVCRHAMVHNGIITQYARQVKYSDSQKFVLGILSDEAILGHFGSPAVRTLIQEFIGKDKVAILSFDGSLHLFGEYIEDEGLLFSNAGYRASRYVNFTNGWDWSKHHDTREPDEQSFQDGVFVSECQGCQEHRPVKTVEVEIEGSPYEYNLCKKCRKKLNKNKLIIEAKTSEHQCENCFDTFPEKQLVQTYYGKMCRRCVTEYHIQNM